MNPKPIKAFLRLSDLFNILFSQAQEIKRLRAENAAKDRIIVDMRRHSNGIILEMEKQAARTRGFIELWNKGAASLKDIE